MNVNVFLRKIHRIVSIIILVPFLIVIVSGILLQLKKEISWVQPPTQSGKGFSPDMTLKQILDFARAHQDTIQLNWGDIDRLDVRPDEGVIKVRLKNHQEIQIDARTGEILQFAVRRSDTIEDLHTGAWFFSAARLWIFLPSAVLVFILWISGLVLLGRKYLRSRKP